MTTVILTIIGILLATAAALMLIFYGGEVFNSGSTGASANRFANAAVNVIAAADLYKVENGSTPTALNDLVPRYLKEIVPVPRRASTPTAAVTQEIRIISGASYYVAFLLDDEVCSRLNIYVGVDDLGNDMLSAPSPDAWAASLEEKMGCWHNPDSELNQGHFYVRL